ncbi:hypothetical protein PSCICO_31760 [Pseudomonas cichorii]|uniref:hypothetical protein n=1 Tax=Pseudomonas cichorii TaxID=36746 RepID=UPI001910D7D8|nr:hypothetical protein [Pseudomonas cichorii]GFM87777.1 hypothetical protein PSCICO_31760 [Pseudomonas cichorii]
MVGPTEKGLRKCVKIAWALIIFAIAVPLLSMAAPYPKIPDLDAGSWFSRSGAVMTVFALLAESVLLKVRLSITPTGFGWAGLNELRQTFLPALNKSDALIFILVITGTMIWAYGDLPFKYLLAR